MLPRALAMSPAPSTSPRIRAHMSSSSTPSMSAPLRAPVMRATTAAVESRSARSARQEVRLVADAWKLREPGHLDRRQPGERPQIEWRRLHGSGQIRDDQDRFAIVAAEVCEDLAVRAPDEFQRAASEDAILFPR